MSFTLSDAVVLIRQEGANRIGPEVAREIEGSGSAASAGLGFAKKLVAGAIAFGIGAKIASNIGESIDLASDLNETVSKSSTIFGANQQMMLNWSENASTSLGLSQSKALGAAASFGDMFTQIGFTGDAAAEMSRGVVQASADLGSFSNLDTADVADRMSAAFRGEYDSLQAVIPNINAARVESEAMAATGKTTAASLTAQEKATAVLAIVQKDGARAMGDFAKTSDGYANQQKIAAAQTEDLKAKIGAGLLPVFAAGAGVLTSTLLPALSTLADIVLARVVPGAIAAAGAIEVWAGKFGGLSRAIREGNVTDYLQEAFGWTPPDTLLGYLDGLRDKVTATFPGLQSVVSVLADVFTSQLLPAVGNIAGSLARAAAETGVSGWALFVSVLQILAPVIQVVAEMLLQVSNFMRDNQGVVNGLLIAYAGFRIAQAAVVAFGVAQAAMTAISYGAAGATYAQGAALTIYKAVMLAGAAASAIATGAQWAFNAAMTANPIGLIIAAIALLIAGIVALVMNWDTVVSFLTTVWGGFVSWFQGVMDGFLGWWNGLWASIVAWVQTTFAPLGQWLIDTWNTLVLGWQVAGAILTTWWNDLWTGIVSWFQAVFGPLVAIALQIWELWGLAWMVAGKILSDWWNALWSGIVAFFQALFAPLVQWGIDTWNNFLLGMQIIGAAIAAWWNAMWDAIGNFFRSLFEPLIQWGINTWNLFLAGMQIIGAAISSWWNSLWSAIGDWFRSTFGPAIEWGKTTWAALSSAFRSVGDALSSWWSGLWSGIVSGFQSAVGFIGGLVDNVISFFTDMQSTVTGALAGAGQWLYDAGTQIINGLTKGIRDTVGAVASAITNGLDSAISGAKAFLGIASPSKLAKKVLGRWILPGVQEGIEDTAPDLQRSMVDAVQLPEAPSNVVSLDAARTARAATDPRGAGDTYNIDITVDASNLQEVDDLRRLFQDLKRAARMGSGKKAA